MLRWIPILLLCATVSRLAAQTETRVYRFSQSPPQLVEKQIRFLVPEEKRVSMNPEAGQVIVVADSETHAKIASMLREMERPAARLRFRVRHNRESMEFTVGDAVPVTLPVSKNPPEDLLRMARSRLPPDQRDLPSAGTALTAHVKLLREDPPAAVRLRVVPAFAFGESPPYRVVSYDELATDVMLTTARYLELPEALAGHDFYPRFFRTRSGPGGQVRSVGLLLSFDRLSFGGEEEGP